jgi:hypothetical protein
LIEVPQPEALCELEDLIPELRRRELLAQVTRFAKLSIEFNDDRRSCEIRARVGSGRIGRFKKLENV